MIKQLNYNPVEYDLQIFELGRPQEQQDITTVFFKCSDQSMEFCIGKKEAALIGEWFLKLSKDLK